MRRFRYVTMVAGSALFVALLVWAIVVGRTNTSLDDPPVGWVVLMLVAIGTVACGAIVGRIEERRDLRNWFKDFKE